MDGAPVRGETIPIRLFLGGFDLTPTFRDVNKKFSTRYYLNLVLIDEEARRYFKQQVRLPRARPSACPLTTAANRRSRPTESQTRRRPLLPEALERVSMEGDGCRISLQCCICKNRRLLLLCARPLLLELSALGIGPLAVLDDEARDAAELAAQLDPVQTALATGRAAEVGQGKDDGEDGLEDLADDLGHLLVIACALPRMETISILSQS